MTRTSALQKRSCSRPCKPNGCSTRRWQHARALPGYTTGLWSQRCTTAAPAVSNAGSVSMGHYMRFGIGSTRKRCMHARRQRPAGRDLLLRSIEALPALVSPQRLPELHRLHGAVSLLCPGFTTSSALFHHDASCQDNHCQSNHRLAHFKLDCANARLPQMSTHYLFYTRACLHRTAQSSSVHQRPCSTGAHAWALTCACVISRRSSTTCAGAARACYALSQAHVP